MIASLFRRLGGPLAVACVSALALVTASARGGSGVGDVFNLGQTNTVDAESILNGNAGGNPQLRVHNASGASNAFGVLGRITSGLPASQSAGLRGINSGTTGNGYGVWGTHQGSGIGVYGSSTDGTGVKGSHDGATGTNPGVVGQTSSSSFDAAGLLGFATSASGAPIGVKGVSSSMDANSGIGVYGSSASTGSGVYGFVPGQYYCSPPPMPSCERRGKAVFGDTTEGYAIYGRSINGYGGYFQGLVHVTKGVTIGPTTGHALTAMSSGGNHGVVGQSSSGAGVFGGSSTGRGVWGSNNANVRSSAGSNPGVYGRAVAEDGVWAISDQATGIYAQAPNYAAYLNGRVFIDRSLSLGWRTFAEADTTPDVTDGSLYRVSNSGSTLITNFDNGRSGQQLTLRFTNSNTDIADNASIKLAGGFSPSEDDTLQLVKDGSIWYELGRSSN
jgi:hypothetical protein